MGSPSNSTYNSSSFYKLPYFFSDPFLQPSKNIYAPPTPQNHNDAMMNSLNKNFTHITNEPQSIVNFLELRSSSDSVNPCMAANRARDDQSAGNRCMVRGHWNPEEDRKLVQLVERYGTKKWSHIAQSMHGRSGKQLRERYNNHLRPGLKREAWAEEEDQKLIEAHEELGNKWAEITRRIPGRSESDIKNRWNATKRKCLNSIKKSRTNPKPSSLFEDYVKNILTKGELSSAVTGESNELGGPSSGGSNGPDGNVNNRQSIADGSVGRSSSSGPSVWADDDYTMGQFADMSCTDILSYGPGFGF